MKQLLFNVITSAKKQHQDKQGITLKEFPLFLRVVLGTFGLSDYKKPFVVFIKNIEKLVNHNGFTGTFNYLKECNRITTRLLSQSIVEKSGKLFIKVDAFGYPTIIPFELRTLLSSKEVSDANKWVMARAILTILCIHRVFPVKVEPKLSTVVEEFSGVSSVLDISRISHSLRDMGLTTKTLGKFSNPYKIRGIGLESSGPNSTVAVGGIFLDALALLHNHNVLMGIYKFLLKSGRLDIIVILTLILSTFGPGYLILRFFKMTKKLELGRLAVVYNQAGKARVIAITSYGVQMVFKPLHNFLFDILRSIRHVDGTFNQLAPFDRLIKSESRDSLLSGFDLSAATDRLPISTQCQILNLLGYDAETWREVLAIDGLVPFKAADLGVDQKYVKYSVGQPMGAYSSGAMLAITHHIIVRYSALLENKRRFTDYCVLGDDVVIANSLVSKAYINIMNTLGLSINAQKSVEGTLFTEFAKKLKGPNLEISPIGSGLIIQTIRVKSYFLRYVQEIFNLGIVPFERLSQGVESAPSFLRTRTTSCRGSVIIGIYKSFKSDGRGFDAGAMNLDPLVAFAIEEHIPALYEGSMALAKRDLRLGFDTTNRNTVYFLRNGYKLQCGRIGYLNIPPYFNLLHPAFGLVIRKILEQYAGLVQAWCKIRVVADFKESGHLNIDLVGDLLDICDNVSLVSIDYSQVKEVKDTTKSLSRLLAYLRDNDDTGAVIFMDHVDRAIITAGLYDDHEDDRVLGTGPFSM